MVNAGIPAQFGQFGQHMAQPGIGFQAVGLGRLNQAVEDGAGVGPLDALLAVSYGFEDFSYRAGNHVNHHDESVRISIPAGPAPGGLKQAVQPFHTGVGVG